MQQSSTSDVVIYQIYYTDKENLHGHSKMGVSTTMKHLFTRTAGNAHLPSIVDWIYDENWCLDVGNKVLWEHALQLYCEEYLEKLEKIKLFQLFYIICSYQTRVHLWCTWLRQILLWFLQYKEFSFTWVIRAWIHDPANEASFVGYSVIVFTKVFTMEDLRGKNQSVNRNSAYVHVIIVLRSSKAIVCLRK